MSDTKPNPASGDARRKGAPDGVSGTPGGGRAAGTGDAGNVHGRSEGGESGGANYPNPQTGKDGSSGESASGHGGQTEMDYYGSGQRGAGGAAAGNAVAGSDDSRHNTAEAPAPAADRPPHQITALGRTFTVVEGSGIAAAEAAGDLGPGAANDTKDSDRAG